MAPRTWSNTTSGAQIRLLSDMAEAAPSKGVAISRRSAMGAPEDVAVLFHGVAGDHTVAVADAEAKLRAALRAAHEIDGEIRRVDQARHIVVQEPSARFPGRGWR